MTSDEKKKIYEALAAPFSAEAIERTDGRVTGKGYSTTGIKYQFIVNRLNEVLGLGGFRVERKVTMKEVATSKGRPAFEASCELKMQLGAWTDGLFVPFAEAIGDGGHTAMALADAIKGAYTNGFKKTVAFFGVGRQAYEGSLDDDHLPADELAGRVAVRPTVRPEPAGSRSENSASSQPTRQADRTGNQGAGPESRQQPSNGNESRARISAKQLQMIWSVVRQRGYVQAEFRRRVRDRYGRQLEYLTRSEASDVITMLVASSPGDPAGSNGSGLPGGHVESQPGGGR